MMYKRPYPRMALADGKSGGSAKATTSNCSVNVLNWVNGDSKTFTGDYRTLKSGDYDLLDAHFRSDKGRGGYTRSVAVGLKAAIPIAFSGHSQQSLQQVTQAMTALEKTKFSVGDQAYINEICTETRDQWSRGGRKGLQ